jgi:flagellar motor component MotA
MILTDIFTALIAFAGTLVGTLSGILAANKLSSYRIEQLEKKVEKHNNLVERMFCVESSVKSAHHRIDELREEIIK